MLYVIYPLESHYSECWHFLKEELKKKEIITEAKSFAVRKTSCAQGQALQAMRRGKLVDSISGSAKYCS